MVRFIQINLNHCTGAQSLLAETAREENVDVLLVTEQHRNEGANWYSDRSGRAAIANVTGVDFDQIGPMDTGFQWVTMKGIRIYSCYCRPKLPIVEYEGYNSKIEDDIRRARGNVLVTRDFNAIHWSWGSPYTDKRGEILERMISFLGLSICNRGGSPTLQKDDGRSSYIDINFATPDVANKITYWEVLQKLSLSDHKYILFELDMRVTKNQDRNKRWTLMKNAPWLLMP